MTTAGQNVLPEDAAQLIFQLRKVSGTPAAYVKTFEFLGLSTAVDTMPVIAKKKTRVVSTIYDKRGTTTTKRRRRNY